MGSLTFFIEHALVEAALFEWQYDYTPDSMMRDILDELQQAQDFGAEITVPTPHSLTLLQDLAPPVVTVLTHQLALAQHVARIVAAQNDADLLNLGILTF